MRAGRHLGGLAAGLAALPAVGWATTRRHAVDGTPTAASRQRSGAARPADAAPGPARPPTLLRAIRRALGRGVGSGQAPTRRRARAASLGRGVRPDHTAARRRTAPPTDRALGPSPRGSRRGGVTCKRGNPRPLPRVRSPGLRHLPSQGTDRPRPPLETPQLHPYRQKSTRGTRPGSGAFRSADPPSRRRAAPLTPRPGARTPCRATARRTPARATARHSGPGSGRAVSPDPNPDVERTPHTGRAPRTHETLPRVDRRKPIKKSPGRDARHYRRSTATRRAGTARRHRVRPRPARRARW